MALLVVRTPYAREADELTTRLKERGVTLTPNSQKLLYLTVQGWYEEPLNFRTGQPADEKHLRSLLREIIDQVPEEDHVEMRKAEGQPAAFADLFAGLYRGGRVVLAQVADKGF
jgi:hypothetical protein